MAARDLLAAVRAGEAQHVPAERLHVVFDWLAITLARRYGLVEADAADAAQDAIVALLEVGEHDDADARRIRNPAAYLIWLARNRAIDRFRNRAFETPSDFEHWPSGPESCEDDRIAALLDDAVTAAAVRTAMRTALDEGDELAVRVVTIWLDTAQEIGKAPSNREVARRTRLSHTSVNQALRRFKTYFPIREADPSNP